MSATSHLPADAPLVLVTVGSDHHRFDRLVRWVDSWLASNGGQVDCVVQHGAADPPVHATGVDFLPHAELMRLMRAADAVVVQGGPMSVVETRAAGRLPVTVPRLSRWDEVVDDHQVTFCRRWAAEDRLALAEDEATLHRALDAALAEPDAFRVSADPEHEAEIATTISRFAELADGAMARSPHHGPEVLMIAGTGRSGTTLVERCLAEVPGVVALGEVLHLWDRALRDDQLCGCGLPFSRCAFWQDVGRVAFGGWDRVKVDEAVTDRARVVRGRRIPALLLGTPEPEWRLRRARLLRRLDALYRAARQAGNAQLVVDSSKHPAYAYLLNRASVSLRCVLVVRDPRGVAYSWSKTVRRPEVAADEVFMPRYSALRSAVDWVGYAALIRALGAASVPVLVVRYEDLVRDPRGTVARILTFSGLPADEPALAHLRPGAVNLREHHTVAGNPMRFHVGDLPIQADEEWRTRLPRVPRMLVSALTAPARFLLSL